MKKIFFLIISMMAAVSLFSFAKQMVFNERADKLIAEDPPPEIMCYDVVEVEMKDPVLVDLQDQLSKLEQLYADKKIDEATYKTRKTDLIKKIEEFSN